MAVVGLGVVDNTFCQALVVQGTGEVGRVAVAQVTWRWDRRRLAVPDHLVVVVVVFIFQFNL